MKCLNATVALLIYVIRRLYINHQGLQNEAKNIPYSFLVAMSTSNTGNDEEAQLPSYDAVRRAHQPPRLSPDARRIFWSFDGPLATSIWIMESA